MNEAQQRQALAVVYAVDAMDEQQVWTENLDCVFCGGDWRTKTHEASCAWKRARELVSELGETCLLCGANLQAGEIHSEDCDCRRIEV
jgi:hypothetical protein